jgi:hypothetical protein
MLLKSGKKLSEISSSSLYSFVEIKHWNAQSTMMSSAEIKTLWDFPQHTDCDYIIKLLQECVENVKNNKISFPIDRYENYEDITNILGAVYAQCDRNKLRWEIVFLNDVE